MSEKKEIEWTAFTERFPERDEMQGEQVFLLWQEGSGTYEIYTLETGEEINPHAWMCVTHWADITGAFPTTEAKQ